MTLVGYWPFQESSGDAIDASGRGNTGTNNGGITQGISGILDTTCYSFNGSDAYVNLGSPSALDTVSDYTISLWVNPNDTTNVNGLFAKTESTSNKEYALSINSGEFIVDIESGGNNYTLTGGPVSTNEWTHLALSVEPGLDVYMYQDGELVASDSGVSSPNVTSTNVNIGRWGGNYNSNYLDGKVSDVRFYNNALQQSEIQHLYYTAKDAYLLTESASLQDATSTPSLSNLSYDQSASAESIEATITALDGTEESDTKVLDGNLSYTFNLSNAHTDYEVRFNLSTTDVTQTPTLSSAELSGTIQKIDSASITPASATALTSSELYSATVSAAITRAATGRVLSSSKLGSTDTLGPSNATLIAGSSVGYAPNSAYSTASTSLFTSAEETGIIDNSFITSSVSSARTSADSSSSVEQSTLSASSTSVSASTSTAASTDSSSISTSEAAIVAESEFAETGDVFISSNPQAIANAADSQQITFGRSYDNPVVISHMVTTNGGQNIDDNVTDITSTSATIFNIEPDLQGHANENHSFFVIEEGYHRTPEGYHIEAGTFTSSNPVVAGDSSPSGTTISFTRNFDNTPVILATINSHNSNDFKTVWINNVTTTSFDLNHMVGTNNSIATEEVGWVAIEANADPATIGGHPAETTIVNSTDTSFTSFDSTPNAIAEWNASGDFGWADGVNLSATSDDWVIDAASGGSGLYGHVAFENGSTLGLTGDSSTTFESAQISSSSTSTRTAAETASSIDLADGPGGRALRFTQNDAVNMQSGVEGGSQVGSHTLSFWIQRTSEDESSYETVFLNGNGSSANDGTGGRLPQVYLLSGDHSRFHYRLSTDVDGNDGVNTPSGTVPLGEVVHIAGVVDLSGPTITIYKNGEQIDQGQLSSSSLGSGLSPVALRDDGRTAEIFNLDDVKWYDRPLSEDEVYNISEGRSVSSGLVHDWSMDEGEGTTVQDIESGNDGTISGAEYVEGISAEQKSSATPLGSDETSSSVSQASTSSSMSSSLSSFEATSSTDLSQLSNGTSATKASSELSSAGDSAALSLSAGSAGITSDSSSTTDSATIIASATTIEGASGTSSEQASSTDSATSVDSTTSADSAISSSTSTTTGSRISSTSDSLSAIDDSRAIDDVTITLSQSSAFSADELVTSVDSSVRSTSVATTLLSDELVTITDSAAISQSVTLSLTSGESSASVDESISSTSAATTISTSQQTSAVDDSAISTASTSIISASSSSTATPQSSVGTSVATTFSTDDSTIAVEESINTDTIASATTSVDESSSIDDAITETSVASASAGDEITTATEESVYSDAIAAAATPQSSTFALDEGQISASSSAIESSLETASTLDESITVGSSANASASAEDSSATAAGQTSDTSSNALTSASASTGTDTAVSSGSVANSASSSEISTSLGGAALSISSGSAEITTDSSLAVEEAVIAASATTIEGIAGPADSIATAVDGPFKSSSTSSTLLSDSSSIASDDSVYTPSVSASSDSISASTALDAPGATTSIATAGGSTETATALDAPINSNTVAQSSTSEQFASATEEAIGVSSQAPPLVTDSFATANANGVYSDAVASTTIPNLGIGVIADKSTFITSALDSESQSTATDKPIINVAFADLSQSVETAIAIDDDEKHTLSEAIAFATVEDPRYITVRRSTRGVNDAGIYDNVSNYADTSRNKDNKI